MFARARRFYRRVERQQVCLIGDCADRFDNLSDLFRALTELVNCFGRIVDDALNAQNFVDRNLYRRSAERRMLRRALDLGLNQIGRRVEILNERSRVIDCLHCVGNVLLLFDHGRRRSRNGVRNLL